MAGFFLCSNKTSLVDFVIKVKLQSSPQSVIIIDTSQISAKYKTEQER